MNGCKSLRRAVFECLVMLRPGRSGLSLAFLAMVPMLVCGAERQWLWPDDGIPSKGSKVRPYLEWCVPDRKTSDAVMIVAPGGAYFGWAGDVEGTPVCEYFKARGLTTVLLRYRTPRPMGSLAKHQWAWEDAQRAIRLVRKSAQSMGVSGENIGFMGFSAGGHLTLLAATSSASNSYPRIDAVDDLPCHVNWAVPVYPAYLLSDGYDDRNVEKGNRLSLELAPELRFDRKTPPMCLMHGDADGFSAMGSVRVYQRLRTMGVPAELHVMAEKPHVFFRNAHAGEPADVWLDRVWEWMSVQGINSIHPNVWTSKWRPLIRNNRPMAEDCEFLGSKWMRDAQNVISACAEGELSVRKEKIPSRARYVLDFGYRDAPTAKWQRITVWIDSRVLRVAADNHYLLEKESKDLLSKVFAGDFPAKIVFNGVKAGHAPQLRHVRVCESADLEPKEWHVEQQNGCQSDAKQVDSVQSIVSSKVAGESGCWYYKPYEYEGWMLKTMRNEMACGLVNVGYPGKFPDPVLPPKAEYSTRPVPGCDRVVGDSDVPPHVRPRPQSAVPLRLVDGIYDVSREEIGYVFATAINRPRLFVGESLPEVRNSNTNYFEQITDMECVSTGRWRSRVPLALRYFRFEGEVRDVSFMSQVNRREPVGDFSCSDARLKKMWNVGVETLRVCTRTFFIDGVKRDRLPWAGDLAVSILSQAYSFGDPEPVKRTLAALGSGRVEDGPVNGIGSFSLWWIVCHDLLQRYFGEPEFLAVHYPKIRARMDEQALHEDERGFLAKDLGWNFMDWTDRKGGLLKSQVTLQIIYFASLQAAARLARRVNDTPSERRWTARAEKLRQAIISHGMDGTRHSRALAVVYGVVDEATCRRYAAEIANGDLPPTVTPYMSAFEIMALVRGGQPDAALRKFESVWGAMVDFGVDTFWEGWDAADKGDERYEYYGRPFGRSLCHAWSSGPVFLIPGCFMGIRPTSDGWAQYEVKPGIPGYTPGARVRIRTKRGVIEIPCGRTANGPQGKVDVFSPGV